MCVCVCVSSDIRKRGWFTRDLQSTAENATITQKPKVYHMTHRTLTNSPHSSSSSSHRTNTSHTHALARVRTQRRTVWSSGVIGPGNGLSRCGRHSAVIGRHRKSYISICPCRTHISVLIPPAEFIFLYRFTSCFLIWLLGNQVALYKVFRVWWLGLWVPAIYDLYRKKYLCRKLFFRVFTFSVWSM